MLRDAGGRTAAKAKEFHDFLTTTFGAEFTSNMLPQLVRLLPAKEKREGLHLGPEARSKRSASSAFEHVIGVRTDYGLFRTRMFGPACAAQCPARRSGAPLALQQGRVVLSGVLAQ